MMTREALARLSAGLIGCAVLLALLPPLTYALASPQGVVRGILGLLRMFTIITNLLVGVVFARIALKGSESVPPLIIGGVMLSIVLVGVVFNLLLAMLPHQTIWDAIGDYVHHVAAPILVPLWWIIFSRHGKLKFSAPFLWALYPLTYAAGTFVVAQFMVRGAGMQSRYPYFFMDVDVLGLTQVIYNMLAISAGFVLTGMIAVAVDRQLSRSARKSLAAAQ